MQQHTAQHLLSAIAGRVARVDTVKWEFFPDSVVVDFVPRLNEGDAGQPLPPLQSLINEVEESTNEAIRAAAAVSWRLVAKDDLDQYPQARGEVKGAALEMQHLRLVFIEGIDANPCGGRGTTPLAFAGAMRSSMHVTRCAGTHLRSTAEIQALKIVACEKDRGATRLRFISGHRLLQHLASSMARDRELNVLLNCGPDAFVSSVDRLQKERKDLAKDHKSASDELATFFGRSLAAALSPPTVSPKAVIYHHRPHSTLAFLSAAAEAALAQRPDALVILAGDDLPVPPAPKKAGAAAPPDPHRKAGVAVEGPFVVYASDASVVVRATAALLPAIGGRGGGRPNRYQGQATNVLAAADVAKEL
jgi:alanyl-tRNA synthetase